MMNRPFYVFVLELKLVFLLSLIYLSGANFSSSRPPLCHGDDRSALLQFKESFYTVNNSACWWGHNIESWKHEGESGDCCSWGGIACDQDTGHVVSLYLPNNCLHGSINSSNSLFRLVHLQFLTLAKNEFTGSIPYSFANLTKLYKLDLSGNHFFEHIPSSFSHLTHLSILYLDSNQLTGQIPASIRNLTQLSDLDLGYNQLTGQIPASIGNLTQLSDLDLGHNQLTGQIPASIGNLTQLNNLYLGSNQLTGQIPVSIGNLTQLITLDLRSNQLTGQIPVSIRNLTRIEWLVVYDNNLTGELDFEYMFLKLKNLNFLALSFNKLSVISKPTINVTLPKFQILDLASCNLYEFPYFLQNQDELIMLDLSENKLHGQIPKSFWNMSKKTLVYLILDANFLTGFDQLPVVLQRSKLYHLNLANNILQGSLPIPPPSIISYNVSNNRLTGEVSPFFCNLTSISFLDLSNNSLGGILPQCLGNISNSLSVLNLQNNNFHGNIPQASVKGCKLKMINLSQNQLQGNIPGSLAGCDRLEFLNLGNNQIHDIFPSWLGTLVVLKVLILGSNKFCGEIEELKSAFDFPMLRIIDLSNNSFTGKLPSQHFQIWNAMKTSDADSLRYWGEYTSYLFISSQFAYWSMVITNKGTKTFYERIQELFVAIDLSTNKFEGEIPIDIGNLKGLRLLNISNNILTGHIPSSFENLTQLEALDLSQNKLSGEIPQQLSQLTFLSFLNVSHNRLTGSIPHGKQFDTYQNNSFKDNPGLCGDPLSKKCGILPPPPPSAAGGEDRSSSSLFEFGWKVVLMGYACGLVIGVFVGHILIERKPEWCTTTFGIKQQKMVRVKTREPTN